MPGEGMAATGETRVMKTIVNRRRRSMLSGREKAHKCNASDLQVERVWGAVKVLLAIGAFTCKRSLDLESSPASN